MKRILVFVVLAAFIFLSCSTQNKNINQDLGNNNNHWIVGTWKQDDGTVWIFDENGTGTAGKEKFIYGISAESEIYLSNGWGARKIFLSPDGKKMIIMGIVFQKNN